MDSDPVKMNKKEQIQQSVQKFNEIQIKNEKAQTKEANMGTEANYIVEEANIKAEVLSE